MKTLKLLPYTGPLLLSTAIVATCLSTMVASAAPPPRDIFHYFAQETMTNLGVLSNATGRIKIHENSVSKGKPQALTIQLRSMEANTTYQLWARVGSEVSLSLIGTFPTEGSDKVLFDFREKTNVTTLPLPAGLNPVSDVRQLSIQTTNGQAILDADLTAPDKLVYFLKQDFGTNDVTASLRINASVNSARLRVVASGLEAGADYSLALDGVTVVTTAADARGRLRTGWDLANPADILTLSQVSILDSTNGVVASTSLP